MKKSILKKYAPALWIVSGALMLLPSVFNSSNNPTTTGVGIMFIIFGIVFSQRKKTDTTTSKKS